jgi:phosphoribosylanthranilate isomerase
MKIKVCGMRDFQNIKELEKLNPDYIGFIFYDKSKRFVGETGFGNLQSSSKQIKKTGVFVDASIDTIKDKISKYNLDAVQLHGAEPVEVCEELKREDVEVIKAFGIDEDFDFAKLLSYESTVDFFLFDTKTAEHGGSGKSFNWDILSAYSLNKPYFLSGGLSLENLESVAQMVDNRLYAVDLNSKFEIKPAFKDIKTLEEAFHLIRGKDPVSSKDI